MWELLMGIIEGVPAGLLIRVTDIDNDLGRVSGIRPGRR